MPSRWRFLKSTFWGLAILLSGAHLSAEVLSPRSPLFKSDSLLGRFPLSLNHSKQEDWNLIPSPSLAAELNKIYTSPRFQEQIIDPYLFDESDFFYFHGFDHTSLDESWAKLYGIDPHVELEERKELASRVQRYMLLYGLPQYLKNNHSTKKLAKNYDTLLHHTHVKRSWGLKKNPWKLSTGINYAFAPFIKLKNSYWFFYARARRFEYREGFHTKIEIQRRLSSLRKQPVSLGAFYLMYEKEFTTYLRWTLSQKMSTQFTLTHPGDKAFELERILSKIYFRYRI